MGQKVNPNGFRLGVNKDWKSKWYSSKNDFADNLLKDIENLLILIRKYNKDEIYFLGFYDVVNNSELIEYTNKKLISICNKNKIKYVDISNLSNYIISGTYPTKEGYMYITDKIFNFTK